MNLLATVFGLLLAAFGLVGMVVPADWLAFGTRAVTSTGLYVIAGIRVCLGLVLMNAAATSRMPRTLRVLGIVVVIAGIATPPFGVERSLAVAHWWASQEPWALRIGPAFVVALGGFMAFASRRVRHAS
jgi:hypothetical protein